MTYEKRRDDWAREVGFIGDEASTARAFEEARQLALPCPRCNPDGTPAITRRDRHKHHCPRCGKILRMDAVWMDNGRIK